GDAAELVHRYALYATGASDSRQLAHRLEASIQDPATADNPTEVLRKSWSERRCRARFSTEYRIGSLRRTGAYPRWRDFQTRPGLRPAIGDAPGSRWSCQDRCWQCRSPALPHCAG